MIRNRELAHIPPAPASRRKEAWMRRRPKHKAFWLVIGSLIVGLFLVVLANGIGTYPFWSEAKVTAVDPPIGLPGEILTMLGRDLGKSKVAEVYLTDGKTAWRAEIIQQSARDIRFRIPANVIPGALHLVLTTPGFPARWIDQSPAIFVPAAKP